MNKTQKLILCFLITVLLFLSSMLIMYDAGHYVLLIIASLVLISWWPIHRGLHRKSIIKDPTPGAVFETGVLWLKTGSFPTIRRNGRLMFLNNRLELIAKNGKVFSFPQDEMIVEALWFYPGPISGGYVRMYIKTRQENFEIDLTPPDYMDTLKTWDQAVLDKTGKHLVQKYLH